MKYNFIPKESEINILAFKYSGNDHSLFYHYIGSPLSEFCVKHLPKTIAPNTVIINIFLLSYKITFFAFLAILIPHCIIYFQFSNNLSGDFS